MDGNSIFAIGNLVGILTIAGFSIATYNTTGLYFYNGSVWNLVAY